MDSHLHGMAENDTAPINDPQTKQPHGETDCHTERNGKAADRYAPSRKPLQAILSLCQ